MMTRTIAAALCLLSLPAMADEQWPGRYVTGGHVMMGPRKVGEFMGGTMISTPDLLKVVGPNGPATCQSTDGNFATDGTQSWEPSCFGVFASKTSSVNLLPTRGANKIPGTNTPEVGNTAMLLVQGRNIANERMGREGIFINWEVRGGSYSGANPVDGGSGSTGLLASIRQRPGANGEPPPPTWAFNADLHIGPGSGNTQSFLYEGDLNNFNKDCHISSGCLAAWFFYGGINPYPSTAFHYIANPHVANWYGTASASGGTFTLASMNTQSSSSPQWDNRVTKIKYKGQWFRVDCPNGTTCIADRLIGNSGPDTFSATSSMAHYGLFFQDNDIGSMVQEHDFFMVDSARAIITAAGNHKYGLDFTQDALTHGFLFKQGQLGCFNGGDACLTYSTAGYLGYVVGGGIPFQVVNGGASGLRITSFGGNASGPLLEPTPDSGVADAPISLRSKGASPIQMLSPVTFTSLAGTGNRYVCANSSGAVYASATACQ